MNLNIDSEHHTTRSRLEARGAELRERVRRVRLDLARAHQPLPKDFSDAAIAVENDEILEAIEATALGELEEVGDLDLPATGHQRQMGQGVDGEIEDILTLQGILRHTHGDSPNERG